MACWAALFQRRSETKEGAKEESETKEGAKEEDCVHYPSEIWDMLKPIEAHRQDPEGMIGTWSSSLVTKDNVLHQKTEISILPYGFVIFNGRELVLGSVKPYCLSERRIPLPGDGSNGTVKITSKEYHDRPESLILWNGGEAAYCHSGTDFEFRTLVKAASAAGVKGAVHSVWHRRREKRNTREEAHAFRAYMEEAFKAYHMNSDDVKWTIDEPVQMNGGDGKWFLEVQPIDHHSKFKWVTTILDGNFLSPALVVPSNPLWRYSRSVLY